MARDPYIVPEPLQEQPDYFLMQSYSVLRSTHSRTPPIANIALKNEDIPVVLLASRNYKNPAALCPGQWSN